MACTTPAISPSRNAEYLGVQGNFATRLRKSLSIQSLGFRGKIDARESKLAFRENITGLKECRNDGKIVFARRKYACTVRVEDDEAEKCMSRGIPRA